MTITRFAPHRPIPILARFALGLTIALSLALPPAGSLPASGAAAAPPVGGPPQNDPAGPTSQYTLARSDQLFVAKSQSTDIQGSTYALKPDLSGVASSTPYADTGTYAADPSWPLIPVRGRFTDPLHEQVLLLSQSNDCAGYGGCTYALHLEDPSSGAGSVPSWFSVESGDVGGSPVAVAAGDLDGRVNEGFPNDEAVVANRGSDGTLQVHVIDYHVSAGDAVATAATDALPSIGTADAGTGSLAVAVGDFDSDGQNEIAVLWQGQGCSVAAPQCLSVPHLSMLRYTNDGQTQSLAVLQPDVPLPSDLMSGSPAANMAFQAAVGNFDGQGTDELAFSFISRDASLAVLGFGRLDETFSVSRYGRNPGDETDFSGGSYCPDPSIGCDPIAAGAPPSLTAGLFWYDEPSGHDLARRQLAMAAMNGWYYGSQDGSVSVQFYDIAFDPSTCTDNPCPLTVATLLGTPNGLEGLGADTASPTISLAAGSFQGVNLNPKDQGQIPWELAVGISANQPASGPASGVTVYRLSGTQAGQFTANTLFSPDSDTAVTSPRLLAYNPVGDSLVLGAPVVFHFANRQVPTAILQDPPKHLDWFYDPQQKHGSWINVDRTNALNLDVAASKTSTYESQSTTGSDWTIGGSLTTNVTGSVGVGLEKIDDAKVGLDVSASVGGQYDKNQSSYNSSSSSYTLSTNVATNDDDVLMGTQRSFTVYRYPIIGHKLSNDQGQSMVRSNDQAQYGFYEITLPGQTIPFGPGGGRNFDWYQPLHENGNVLSYPAVGNDGLVHLDPSNLGPPVVLNGSGNPPLTLPQPLVNKSYVVDPTGSDTELTISGTNGTQNSSSTTGTLSESLDIDAGVSGTLNAGVVGAQSCADVDLKFDNSNSWSSLKTSSTTTTSTNTFTLSQDSSAQSNWAYGAATAYYTDPVGAYRAEHAVNVLLSSDASSEWKKRYGGLPDPALNLPDRVVMTYNLNDKTSDIPNWNDADSRQLIRGFFVLHPDADHGGASGSLQAGAPDSYPVDGDTVQLQVRVFNRSLDTPATGVPVRFVAVPRDARDERNVGQPVDLGTVTLDNIPALGWEPANLLWDTSGKAASGVQLYRIFVIVAANDPNNPNDPWNNVIHAWQDRYNDPATVDGTPATDRLTDPLTGNNETLEAGQNKQGWGEVTIYPKPTSSAPRTAVQASAAPAVRFGDGGMEVSAPRGASAASGSGVTTDRVHELRVNVAADTRGALLGNSFCHDQDSATLLVYEGDPDNGGTVVGMKTVHGLSVSGAGGQWVTLPWTPRTAGRRQLVARLYSASTDPNAKPVEATLNVDVAPAAEAPPSLGRLLQLLQVVWLPDDLRTTLEGHLQDANAAAVTDDQAAARSDLTVLRQQTDAGQGKTVSGHSSSRVDAEVDALLAQPTIAAAAGSATEIPKTPAPAATSTLAAPSRTPTPAAATREPVTPPSR